MFGKNALATACDSWSLGTIFYARNSWKKLQARDKPDSVYPAPWCGAWQSFLWALRCRNALALYPPRMTKDGPSIARPI